MWLERTVGGRFTPVLKTPISDPERVFLKTCDTYLTDPKRKSSTPLVSLFKAEVFYKRGHYAKVITQLEGYLDEASIDPVIEYIGIFLLDSAYHLKRWRDMESWARRLRDNRTFKVFTRYGLNQLIADSMTWQMSRLVQAGQFNAAQEKAKKLLDEFGRNLSSAMFLRQFAEILEFAGQTDGATAIYEELAAGPIGTSAFKKEIHFILGVIYQGVSRGKGGLDGEQEKAASFFEKAGTHPSPLVARLALYQAILIRLNQRKYQTAVRSISTFMRRFPKDHHSELIAHTLDQISASIQGQSARKLMLMSVRIRANLEQNNAAIAAANRFLERYPTDKASTELRTQINVWRGQSKSQKNARASDDNHYAAGGHGSTLNIMHEKGKGRRKGVAYMDDRYINQERRLDGDSVSDKKMCRTKGLRWEIQSVERDIKICQTKVKRAAPKVYGRLHLEWIVGKDGRGSELELRAIKAHRETLHSCILSKAKNWRFTKPASGPCRVVLPIIAGLD